MTVKVKVESNLSWVLEKSDKILTRHVGDQILKFLSPTENLLVFASGRVVICNPDIRVQVN